MPPTLATLYTSLADAQALAGAAGVSLRLDDDQSGVVDATELAYLTGQGCSWATQRVDLYVYQRYVPSTLADSWLVNYWATMILGVWLATRRGNPVPRAWVEPLKQVYEDLMFVKTSVLTIPPPALLRSPPVIMMSNVWVDHRYWVQKLRVERWTSVAAGIDYARQIDRWADYVNET